MSLRPHDGLKTYPSLVYDYAVKAFLACHHHGLNPLFALGSLQHVLLVCSTLSFGMADGGAHSGAWLFCHDSLLWRLDLSDVGLVCRRLLTCNVHSHRHSFFNI